MNRPADCDLAAELAEMREVAALCRLRIERKAAGFRLVLTDCMPEIASPVLPDLAALRMALHACFTVRDNLAALLLLCTAPAAGGIH